MMRSICINNFRQSSWWKRWIRVCQFACQGIANCSGKSVASWNQKPTQVPYWSRR